MIRRLAVAAVAVVLTVAACWLAFCLMVWTLLYPIRVLDHLIGV